MTRTNRRPTSPIIAHAIGLLDALRRVVTTAIELILGLIANAGLIYLVYWAVGAPATHFFDAGQKALGYGWIALSLIPAIVALAYIPAILQFVWLRLAYGARPSFRDVLDHKA